MKAAWVCLGLAAALALQTVLARWLAGTDVALDLVLVVVVIVALAGGPVNGLLTGTVGGLAQDTLSGGIIGVGGLAKTVVGFVVGIVGQQFIVARPMPRFVVLFVATLLHALLFLGLYAMLPSERSIGVPYRLVLRQALGNAAAGLLVFQVAEFAPGLMQRRRMVRSQVRHRRLGEWGSR